MSFFGYCVQYSVVELNKIIEMTSSAVQPSTGGNYVYRSLPRTVAHLSTRLKHLHYRNEM